MGSWRALQARLLYIATNIHTDDRLTLTFLIPPLFKRACKARNEPM